MRLDKGAYSEGSVELHLCWALGTIRRLMVGCVLDARPLTGSHNGARFFLSGVDLPIRGSILVLSLR